MVNVNWLPEEWWFVWSGQNDSLIVRLYLCLPSALQGERHWDSFLSGLQITASGVKVNQWSRLFKCVKLSTRYWTRFQGTKMREPLHLSTPCCNCPRTIPQWRLPGVTMLSFPARPYCRPPNRWGISSILEWCSSVMTLGKMNHTPCKLTSQIYCTVS